MQELSSLCLCRLCHCPIGQCKSRGQVRVNVGGKHTSFVRHDSLGTVTITVYHTVGTIPYSLPNHASRLNESSLGSFSTSNLYQNALNIVSLENSQSCIIHLPSVSFFKQKLPGLLPIPPSIPWPSAVGVYSILAAREESQHTTQGTIVCRVGKSSLLDDSYQVPKQLHRF